MNIVSKVMEMSWKIHGNLLVKMCMNPGVYFTKMASTVTGSQSNRALLGCDGTEYSHHGCAADKSAATA